MMTMIPILKKKKISRGASCLQMVVERTGKERMHSGERGVVDIFELFTSASLRSFIVFIFK
jgi:hypothetical protein